MVQCGLVHCGLVQCGLVQCGLVQFRQMPCGMVQCGLYSVDRCSVCRSNVTVVQCGLVHCTTVWAGTLHQCGLVKCGTGPAKCLPCWVLTLAVLPHWVTLTGDRRSDFVVRLPFHCISGHPTRLNAIIWVLFPKGAPRYNLVHPSAPMCISHSVHLCVPPCVHFPHSAP